MTSEERQIGKQERQAKKLLDNFVNFLNDEGIDTSIRRDVWNVLTALRGPDNDNDNLKSESTSRIRHVLGLKLSSTGFLISENTTLPTYDIVGRDGAFCVVEKRTTGLPNVNQRFDRISFHFFAHINYAVDALRRFGYPKVKP